MRKSIKWTLSTLAIACVGCGSVAAAMIKPVTVHADEATPVCYVNVGATEGVAASEYLYENSALAVDPGFSGTAGTDENGLGVFATYKTNASHSFTVTAGTYQVAALVDAGASVTVNSNAVSAAGKRVVSTEVTSDGTITVATGSDVKLYAVMIAPQNSKILMHSEWTEGQVVVYGRLLEEELTRGCPAYYSNGAVESAIEYTNIPTGIGDGSTGINENFNAVTATGMFGETAVSRYLIAMPEKLVYFANLGSVNGVAGPFGNETDPYYSYNQTVFDYYRSVGSTLKNDGIPDQKSSGSSVFGWTTNGWNGGDRSSNYPFNSGRVTRSSDFGTVNLEYHLPNVEAGDYVLYIGTISYWHGRTLGVQVNGQAMSNINVPPARVVHTFNISRTSTGTVTVKLTGASTNEALASFIALQKASDAPEAAPGAVSAEVNVIGLTDTSVELKGVQEGARIQLYNGSRPYNLIYEETAVAGNFEDGVYTLNFGKTLEDYSKVVAVQLTSGGYGGTYELSVTDIMGFKVQYTVNGHSRVDELEYTTSDVVLHISAHATSGLDYYKVRKNYNPYTTYDLDGAYAMDISYDVTENANYEFVIYSLLGVSYTEVVTVNCIDRSTPTLAVTPTGTGWDGASYSFKVDVNTVAAVTNYKVYKNGVQVKSQDATQAAPLESFRLNLAEAGEYTIAVTTATGQVATGAVVVGGKPVYSKITKTKIGNDLELTFECIDGYTMRSLAVYQVSGGAVSKLSVIGSDTLDVYEDGTYVAVVKTNTGATEVFSFEIASSELGKTKTGKKANYTGTIVTACVFGVAVAGLAATLIILKKKSK